MSPRNATFARAFGRCVIALTALLAGAALLAKVTSTQAPDDAVEPTPHAVGTSSTALVDSPDGQRAVDDHAVE